MEIVLFFILYILPPLLPILFGMTIALLVLIPHIRNWNQSYERKIATSLGLAFLATLMFQFLNAYGSVELKIYVSRAMNPLVIDNLLDGSRDDVEKELLIRALRPRLELQPCYSEQESICEIANTVEIYANEGYAPLKGSIKGYLRSVGITFLSVWIGSLLVVLRLTTMKQAKTVSA
jgi:hypothetical protein